jgi:ApeA N-terminal domain 1
MADKNLRLDSRFSMIGAFWSPETPDTVIKGTLVSDEREINFITAPEYERPISIGLGMFAMPDSTMIPALHGFTQDGLFTLCQLVEQPGPGSTNFVVGQAIKARSFRVLSCLGGMHINGIDHKCLNSARYTFEGLSAWFPQAFDEKWDTDQIVVTIPMEPRQIQDFCLLDSRVRISVKVVSELTSGKDDPSRLSRSIASVEVQSPNPESLAWYRRIGGRLENLFSLLTGGSVAMDTLFVYRAEIRAVTS